jgi:recombination protein RecT
MATQDPKTAAVMIAAQKISEAREKFEGLVRRTGAQLVFEREARFALEIVQRSKQLQGADPATIYSSILNVASIGLSLNPTLGEAALIPRWNKDKGMNDCTLSPMYRGLVRLATESGRVSHIKAELVFEGDGFKLDLGTDPTIHHDPTPSLLGGEGARVVDLIDRKRNKLRAVYVVAHLGSGEKIIGVMSYDEILKVALCSESFNPKYGKAKERGPTGPWVEHPGEMAKKSLINREQKTWPRVVSGPDKLDAAIEVMREADEKEGYTSNVEPRQERADVEAISPEQVKQISDLAERQSLPLERVCENFKIEAIEAMPASEFKGAVAKLSSRLEKYLELKAAKGGPTEESTEGEAEEPVEEPAPKKGARRGSAKK